MSGEDGTGSVRNAVELLQDRPRIAREAMVAKYKIMGIKERRGGEHRPQYWICLENTCWTVCNYRETVS